jgi:hypothetical protein
MDGVGTHHFGVGSEDAAIDELIAALRAAAPDRKGARARRKVYAAARAGDAIRVVDPLLERLRAVGMPAEQLQGTARWLVSESRHREPVKLGIALLGLGHSADDRDILKVLGRHEEFTLFVAVALANTTPAPDRELYALARSVEAWGRVHLVERLKDTEDPEIREWIFRAGFRNAVMNEYLAYTAATTGELVRHLEEPVDPEALDAACDIVSALLMGGPAEDIDDYADGARAIILLLRRLDESATRLGHFLVADDIGRFLARDDGCEKRAQRGWTDEVRTEAQRLVAAVRAKPHWEALALEGLDSTDSQQFYEAERTARSLGHDTYAAHWRRVVGDPIGGNWWAVMHHATDERIDEILEFATTSLPLDDIGAGPGTSLGLGPEWAAHQALDFIVQDLNRFPGRGWPLIRAALRSPVVRNRNMAVNALFGWEPADWPADAAGLVSAALDEEPDERVRERLRRLSRGEPDVEP